jgi:predicted nucleic-acid-binding Zn-ribbon protein
MPMPPSTTATECWTLTGMRNTHSCPKCRSTEILQIPGKAGAYWAGNNISTGPSIFSAVLVTRYLCAPCGFSEEWVDDKAGMEKLSAKYNH